MADDGAFQTEFVEVCGVDAGLYLPLSSGLNRYLVVGKDTRCGVRVLTGFTARSGARYDVQADLSSRLGPYEGAPVGLQSRSGEVPVGLQGRLRLVSLRRGCVPPP